MSKNIIAALVSVVLFVGAIYPLFFVDKLYSLASMQENFAPKEEREFAKQYIALLHSHDLEAVHKYLDPKIAAQVKQTDIDKIIKLLPSGAPKSIKFIGAQTTVEKYVSNTNLTLEYEFPNQWFLASIALQKQDEHFLVEGFSIQPLNDALEKLTQFNFWGQDAKHYIVFTIALALLLFNIYALASCIKTPIPKKKWLWIIFILFGFCAIVFDWTSGRIYFTPLTIKLPVVQFSQMLYQPFLITMTVPLGSIVFLLKRKKWLA